jgi:UDP-N-acetylglucosamine diphosphorylase / glucose-1-phosphate thymidylyltransferase / UDP-N-acetylgalactosamine diphosphorylase / glucosamine-1-phosphate N-acetyltransferase / galactosamine-1-phosphate N-acetyltransferase
MRANQLFELPKSIPFGNYFKPSSTPWEWVPAIKEALSSFNYKSADSQNTPSGVVISGDVYIHPSVKLPPFASIQGPAWIGAGTEIRPGAFIRGNVIIGENCVIGNSCEYKNCLLMDNVQTPHYNYIGDSILGSGSHLGAGVILSNLRLDQANIHAHTDHGRIDTEMRKLGAILGEHAEVGCNAVLQPGTILGKKSVVMPLLAYSGYLPDNSIAYAKPEIKVLQRKD